MNDSYSFRPLMPVDSRGLDEIADDLAGIKKPKETKVLKGQEKNPVEEAKLLKKEINEKSKQLAKLQPKKLSTGAKVGIGFGALSALVLGFGIYRIADESFDSQTFTEECLEVEETKGFWGEDVGYKFCLSEYQDSEDNYDSNPHYKYMEITLFGWLSDYKMIDIVGNDLPVDKLIIDGKEYTPQNAPDGMFIEANRLWNEYMDFWDNDVNDKKDFFFDETGKITDDWLKWRDKRIEQRQVEQRYEAVRQESAQPAAPVQEIQAAPAENEQHQEEQNPLPNKPEQPAPLNACMNVEREAEGIGRLQLNFCTSGMMSIYNFNTDYQLIDSDGNGEIDLINSRRNSWSRENGRAIIFDEAAKNWKQYWEAGNFGSLYEQYKPMLESLVQETPSAGNTLPAGEEND